MYLQFDSANVFVGNWVRCNCSTGFVHMCEWRWTLSIGKAQKAKLKVHAVWFLGRGRRIKSTYETMKPLQILYNFIRLFAQWHLSFKRILNKITYLQKSWIISHICTNPPLFHPSTHILINNLEHLNKSSITSPICTNP